MKKNQLLILIFVLAVTVSVAGCGKVGDEANKTVNPPSENSRTGESDSIGNKIETNDEMNKPTSAGYKIEMTDEIRKAASEEGISAEDLLDIVRIRAQTEANSRGITLGEYVKMIENNNSTPYQAVKEAADTMDFTIVEFHEMLESIKTNSNTGGTLSETDLPNSYPINELPLVNVDEITVMAENESYIDISYISQDSYDELKTFYDYILNGTENYRNKDYETVLQLSGTINGQLVKVDIADSGQVNIQITK